MYSIGMNFHHELIALLFYKKEFSPKGDLIIRSRPHEWEDVFCRDEFVASNCKHLPFELRFVDQHVPADAFTYKVLRNFPFARRGYVFKDSKLQAYYQAQSWYVPDASYKPSINNLLASEAKFIESLDSRFSHFR